MNLLKKIAAMAMTGVLLFSVAACGTDTGGGSGNTGSAGGTGATPASGNTMRVNIASEPESMDPTLNTTLDGGNMIQHNFEGLMKFVDNGDGVAVLAPGQAESYEKTVNEDGTVTYDFKLRPGIKWSDGQDVTAKDFVYSWQRMVNPETASDYAYMGYPIVNAEAIVDGEKPLEDLAAEAVSDTELKVTLVNDVPYFLELTSFATFMPLREDIISANPTWTLSPDTFISNGPMKVSERVIDSKVVMVPNEHYYDKDVVKLDSLEWVMSDDGNAMLAAFNNDEIDFVEKNAPANEIPTLIESGQIKINPMVGTYYVAFNNEEAPFDDPLVREAFSLVIDRNYITNQVTRSGEIPATGFVPDGVYDAEGPEGPTFREAAGESYFATTEEEYKANCERARELLAEAGYPDGEGLPTINYIYNTLDTHRVIAEALQNMWQTELGANVTLSNQDWKVFIDSRRSGNYIMARHGWIADYNDPISFLDLFVTGNGTNDPNFSNPEYDALIAEAKATDDPVARMEALHKAEEIFLKEAGSAPIYFYANWYMMKDDYSGMFYTPLGYFYFYGCEKAAG